MSRDRMTLGPAARWVASRTSRQFGCLVVCLAAFGAFAWAVAEVAR